MAYVLFPGIVISSEDGQIHLITAPELARLYGVDYTKCKVVYRNKPSSIRGYRKTPDDIELYPKSNGRYELP